MIAKAGVKSHARRRALCWLLAERGACTVANLKSPFAQ